MTRSAAQRRRKKGHYAGRSTTPSRAAKPASDAAIYGGIVLIGAFGILLFWLLSEGRLWREAVIGYLLAMVWFVNAAVYQVYRGRHLPHWKQSLARVPLRFVGFGTRDGRPFEAAHGRSEVRLALLVSIAVSVLIILGMTLLLFPP